MTVVNVCVDKPTVKGRERARVSPPPLTVDPTVDFPPVSFPQRDKNVKFYFFVSFDFFLRREKETRPTFALGCTRINRTA